MAKATHQANWRKNSQRTRVEIYLNTDELALLDGLGGTRAEAIRSLLATNQALPEYPETSAAPSVSEDVMDRLKPAFAGADGSVNWQAVAEFAALHHQREAEKEAAKHSKGAVRSRRWREKMKAEGRKADPNSPNRSRRWREAKKVSEQGSSGAGVDPHQNTGSTCAKK